MSIRGCSLQSHCHLMISLELAPGLSMGDTNNCRFGGTQPGWIGDRSVPTTRALGYSSAKSLQGSASELLQGVCYGKAYIAQIPVLLV